MYADAIGIKIHWKRLEKPNFQELILVEDIQAWTKMLNSKAYACEIKQLLVIQHFFESTRGFFDIHAI